MKKCLFFAFLFFFFQCRVAKFEDIDVVKNDVDSSNCFLEGHGKFVSLFFAKTNNKRLVQMATFIDRPYEDSTLCYYRRDSSYIYICSGFCDDFINRYGFQKWTDSMNLKYPSFKYYMNLSDSLYEFYIDKFRNMNVKYYEYVQGNFIPMDSIDFENKYMLDCQADSFNIGYILNGPLPPPPAE